MIIREANLDDAKGIAKVHVDSWRTTYKNIIPADFLSNLSYDSREQLWINNIPKGNVFVAENELGQIVGFSSSTGLRNFFFSILSIPICFLILVFSLLA